ncbi:hypothetical protein [Actinoplanes siamensis]|uniref:Amidohydrolase n=1 Tax=Actinoplanes siamensis TaxID=1223317 RepID=A0A919N5W4_9ACTN|nr:hypothetical protein [Actinoplanes siamensis]GIF04917.1 hypothetical protein Asi03nite_24550 [Actinoplanes siamensis]
MRGDIRRLAGAYEGATVSFADAPFPAMIAPRSEGEALIGHLRRTIGDARTVPMHVAPPFNGEDFALFLNRSPGTCTFLGVRRPDAEIRTSFPDFGAFDPDERAIGHGVRVLAPWLAGRAQG